MKIRPNFLLILLIILSAGIGIVSASPELVEAAETVYDEAIHGGLSSNGLSPTPITLAEGTNTITASANPFPDHRYFRITVPENATLDAITLTAHGGDPISWFAVMAGDQFTDTANYPSVSSLLGHSHIGPGEATLPYNVLPNMIIANDPMPVPMEPGTYTFRIQNYGSGVQFTFNYELSIAPTAVAVGQTTAQHPTPWTLTITALLLVIFSCSWMLRRR